MRPCLVLPTLALFLFIRPADGHDPGFSTAVVTVGAREIEAVVTYSTREVADRTGPPPPPAFLINGSMPGAPKREHDGGDDNSIFHLKTRRPANGAVTLSAPLLDSLAPGHRQHLLIRDEEKAVLMNCFLHRGAPMATLTLRPLPVLWHGTSGLLHLIEAVALAIIALFFYAFRRPARFRSRYPRQP